MLAQLSIPDIVDVGAGCTYLTQHLSTVVGVVELTAREIAYRAEASSSGRAQLVRRKLGEVLCLRMPTPYAALTNKVANTPPLNPTQFPTNQPIPAYQNGILSLQSLPGAKGVIYLDFQGGYTPTSGGVKPGARVAKFEWKPDQRVKLKMIQV